MTPTVVKAGGWVGGEYCLGELIYIYMFQCVCVWRFFCLCVHASMCLINCVWCRRVYVYGDGCVLPV